MPTILWTVVLILAIEALGLLVLILCGYNLVIYKGTEYTIRKVEREVK